MIGESTNATRSKMPGRKNLSGIETFDKYVIASKSTVIARKAAIRNSPCANALWVRVTSTEPISNRTTSLKAKETLPLKNEVIATYYLSNIVKTNAGEFLRPH
jgi:hypothetical protein